MNKNLHLLGPVGLCVLAMGASAKMVPSHHDIEQSLPFVPPSEYSALGRWNGDQPIALYGLSIPAIGADPRSMAASYLASHRAELGLAPSLSLQHKLTRSGPAGHNVHFEQYLGQHKVYNGRVVVHISPQDRVTQLAIHTPPHDLALIPALDSLSQAEAEAIAIAAIGASAPFRLRRAEQVIYPDAERNHRVWQVHLIAAAPIGDWEVLVDAADGRIHALWDRAAYATGSVFDPDPLSSSQTAYGQPIVDNNDDNSPELSAQVQVKDLGELNLFNGLFALSSEWAELVDSEAPATGFYFQNSPDFLFERDEDGFEASNVFWHIQESMDYINNTLGIELRPYQYEGGVRFDPHGLNGDDNSHYSTGSGEVAFGEGCVDDSEDGDVIRHELAHGLHDWVTAGGLSNMIDGLSEGISDYWAQSYSRSLGHWQPDTEQYHWVFDWDGHNECWAGRVTNYDLPWPVGITPFPAIHTGGQIISTCLMPIFDQLGRERTDTILLEGLAMTMTISSQNDAANAIYQAAADMGFEADELSFINSQMSSCGYIMAAPLGIDLPPPLGPDASIETDKEPGAPDVVVAEPRRTAAAASGALGWGLILLMLPALRRRGGGIRQSGFRADRG